MIGKPHNEPLCIHVCIRGMDIASVPAFIDWILELFRHFFFFRF